VRFAHAIYEAGLNAQYECSSGIGNSSVDFKIINVPGWLVELTSFRISAAVKEHTVTKGNISEYLSITGDNSNAPEVRDIIKSQEAICRKVSDSCNFKEKGNPIKFPEIKENSYHMLLIDMRSFNAGMSDLYDYWNIAYGSTSLINYNHGIYCRNWCTPDGKTSLIKGLFDDLHPDNRSQYIRDKIHVLGFVHEKHYAEQELINNIYFLYNPKFFKSKMDIIKIFPCAKNELLHLCANLNGKPNS